MVIKIMGWNNNGPYHTQSHICKFEFVVYKTDHHAPIFNMAKKNFNLTSTEFCVKFLINLGKHDRNFTFNLDLSLYR